MNRCRADHFRSSWWFVAIVVLCAFAPLAAFSGLIYENQRATAAEARIIQSTLDRIADVAHDERRTSCEADEDTRAVANRILVRFGQDPAFAPRNCERIAMDYAKRLREAGPEE